VEFVRANAVGAGYVVKKGVAGYISSP